MTVPSPAAPTLVATYRLQMHRGFTFADAAAVVPYLADLGVSHLYLSPVAQAVPGSTHGYDQCDPTRLSDDLGGDTGFRVLSTTARAHGLGIVLDIVPNHMAASADNPWWWELLRSGRGGPAGTYFDVDWETPDPELHGRVMAPVLGAPLPEVLERGDLRVEGGARGPVLTYFEQRFPLTQDPHGHTLADVLAQQPYVLAHWREALHRLNYRRFFDINSLVALREEDPAVFAAVHQLPLALVDAGDVHGLRVDHVDGLRDPQGYLDNLGQQAHGAWLLVEKILEPGERLPDGWPVSGTTGYDFIHRLQGVFVDPAAEGALTAVYQDFTGETATFAEVVSECKAQVAEELFAPDVARLERILAELCASSGVNATPQDRQAAIIAVAVAMPVYRTYRRPGEAASADDLARVEEAVTLARAAEPGADDRLFRLIADALLIRGDSALEADFALRFQQFSGPLMAKGVEDTAFYRYHRLVCLNEVGGDPGAFGVSPAEFHAANRAILAHHPLTMLASSTHDTKRSEDVRARLALLSQSTSEWGAAVHRWSELTARHHRGGLPDRNTEYLLYQTLVGAWPLSEDRVLGYMQKAVREARRHTSWINPNDQYEAAIAAFVTAVMRDEVFQADLGAFAQPLLEPGFIQSLAQCLVKLTAPGIPDIYQGTEAWDLSLVDPDNRRAVDFGKRRNLLMVQRDALRPGVATVDPGSDRWDQGLAKIHVTAQALRARRTSEAAFGEGSTYTPIPARGPGADHVLAFARGTADDPLMVVAVVPRLVFGRDIDWAALRLDLGPGRWADRLWSGPHIEGPALSLGQLFEHHTLALLERA